MEEIESIAAVAAMPGRGKNRGLVTAANWTAFAVSCGAGWWFLANPEISTGRAILFAAGVTWAFTHFRDSREMRARAYAEFCRQAMGIEAASALMIGFRARDQDLVNLIKAEGFVRVVAPDEVLVVAREYVEALEDGRSWDERNEARENLIQRVREDLRSPIKHLIWSLRSSLRLDELRGALSLRPRKHAASSGTSAAPQDSADGECPAPTEREAP